MSLEESIIFRKGNTIIIEFSMNRAWRLGCSWNNLESRQYVIRNATSVQIRTKSTKDVRYVDFIYVKFQKMRKEDTFRYIATITSEKLNVCGAKIGDSDSWQLVHSREWTDFKFDLNIRINIVSSVSKFPLFYDDEKLTDFELKGNDGSVKVHKLVLAACSPVLRETLSGNWMERSETYLDVPEMSKDTLQHMKDYMYLHKLPDNGLLQLLLLASQYKMQELEQQCVDKIVDNMTGDNAFKLFEFTAKYKIRRLLLSILENADTSKIREEFGINNVKQESKVDD